MTPYMIGFLVEGILLLALLVGLLFMAIRRNKNADLLPVEEEEGESAAERKARLKQEKAERKAMQKAAAAEAAAAESAAAPAAEAADEDAAAAEAARKAEEEAKRAEAEAAARARAEEEARRAAEAATAATSAAEDDDSDENAASFEDESAGDEVTELYDEATGKRYRRRYEFSFSARLIQASPDLQMRYGWLKDVMACYPSLKAEVSWKHGHIAAGRKTIATILFQGTQMCIAFALTPDDIEGEHKFNLTDVSSIKRFKNTPLLLKLTSNAKAQYACELLGLAADVQGIARKGEVTHAEAFSVPYQSTDDLVAGGLVKLFTSEIVS